MLDIMKIATVYKYVFVIKFINGETHWKPIWRASSALKGGFPIKLSPKVFAEFQRNPIFSLIARVL